MPYLTHMSFWSEMASELGARRKRLRKAVGDRGQGLFEMLLLGLPLLGSLGLFLHPWMPGAAPWGFALPFLLVLGYLLLDVRRQGQLARGDDQDAVRKSHDRMAFGLVFLCMAASAAAFAIGLAAAPQEDGPDWQPPPDAVSVDIEPQ